MPSDGAHEPFLTALHQRLSADIHASAWTEPDTVAWLVDARDQLHHMIQELESVGSPSSPTYVRALHLRATVCSRLLRTIDNSADGLALAEQGLRDETIAIRVIRELVLQGHAEARLLLGDMLHRVLVLVERHPHPSPAIAARGEAAVVPSLPLLGPLDSTAVPTSARLASAFARAALDLGDDAAASGSQARDAVASSLHWADFALDRFADADRPTQKDALEQLVACLWNTVMAANAVWTRGPDDASRFLDLVSARWDQLAELVDLGEPEATPTGTSHAEIRGMLTLAVAERIEAMEKLLQPFAEGTPDLGAVFVLRHLVRRLPDELWSRNVSAHDVAARLAARDAAKDLHEALQTALDALEVRCLVAALLALSQQVSETSDLAAADEGAIMAQIVLGVLGMAPVPTHAHLSVALHRLGDGTEDAPPLAMIEQELDALDQEAGSSKGGADAPAEAADAATFDAVSRALTETGVGDDRWLEQIEVAVRDHCLPLAQQRLGRAVQFAYYALTFATEHPERLSHANALGLLELATDAAARFAELGEERPVLELARADLLFILTNSDHVWFEALGRAAAAVVRHADDPTSAADDPPLFDTADLVRALRYAGIAAIFGDAPGSSDRPGDASDVIERLRAIAGDPAVSPRPQRLAASFAAELTAVQGHLRRGDRNEVEVDPDQLIITRPILYLVQLLAADGEPPDGAQDRISQAIETHIRSMSHVDRVTRAAADHLELLTRGWAARRLGLTDSQLLTVGRLVYDKVDPTSPGAANLALQVAVNLSELLTRPESSARYSNLAEDIAERFLASALADARSAGAAAEFMTTRAMAALNGGAVMAAEYDSRYGVAVAAHLLAVAQNDLDLAARSAYQVGEILRCAGSVTQARRWYAAYDEWRLAGGLEDEGYAKLRAAIEHDRRTLDTRHPTG